MAITAIILALLAIALWPLLVIPALVISGRLSELERQAEIETALWRLATTRTDDDLPPGERPQPAPAQNRTQQ